MLIYILIVCLINYYLINKSFRKTKQKNYLSNLKKKILEFKTKIHAPRLNLMEFELIIRDFDLRM